LIFCGPGELEDISCCSSPNILSDHQYVFGFLKANIPKPQDKYIVCRDYSDERIELFERYLISQIWLSVAYVESVNGKYAAFMRIFLLGFYEFFPAREKIIRANQLTRRRKRRRGGES
jgi:hypothetical protein